MALPTVSPSGQQHVDFSSASAAAAPSGHQLVADFHGQQQQQQQQPHDSQPQLQQHFGLYAQYYNPEQQQFGFVSTSQAHIECHRYQPPRVELPLGSTAGQFQPGPPPSQPQQPARYTQSFTSNDIHVFMKQERSSSSPRQQQASSTPPQSAAPAGSRHPERPSVDALSALPEQFGAATTVTMSINPKLPPAASMRKTRSASSPKAGIKRSREETDVGGDNEGSAEPHQHKKKRGRPRVEGGCEPRGERRRQQIRDAQRAYRNRKDNRIVELEEQVKRLEREKVNMYQDFDSVLDLLRGQGIAEISAVTAQCIDDLRRNHPLGTLDYHDCDAQSVISSNAGRETVPSTKAPTADTGHHKKRP